MCTLLIVMFIADGFVGKSTLLTKLTGTFSEAADYEFTTYVLLLTHAHPSCIVLCLSVMLYGRSLMRFFYVYCRVFARAVLALYAFVVCVCMMYIA